MKEKYFINARIIDPSQSLDEIGGIIIDEKGKVKEVGKASTDAVNKTVNAAKEEVLPHRDIETGLEKAKLVEKEAGEYLKNVERENIVEELKTNPNNDNNNVNNEKM